MMVQCPFLLACRIEPLSMLFASVWKLASFMIPSRCTRQFSGLQCWLCDFVIRKEKQTPDLLRGTFRSSSNTAILRQRRLVRTCYRGRATETRISLSSLKKIPASLYWNGQAVNWWELISLFRSDIGCHALFTYLSTGSYYLCATPAMSCLARRYIFRDGVFIMPRDALHADYDWYYHKDISGLCKSAKARCRFCQDV